MSCIITIELKEVAAYMFAIDDNRIEFSFLDLYDFGNQAIYRLKERGKTAVLHEINISEFMEECSDIYDNVIVEEVPGIRLKKEISRKELWKKYCSPLSLKVLKAFRAVI